MKVKFFIPSIMVIFLSMSCSRSPAECRADYDSAIDHCEKAEEGNKAKVRDMKDQCHTIEDSQKRDKCMQGVQQEKERQQVNEDKCKTRAKEQRDDCLKKAKEGP